MMFDWLAQEIETIKTRRFHVVDGAADAALRKAVEKSAAPLPDSYKEFVLRFGNAKLYKEHGYYNVGVLAAPVVERDDDGEELYRIGHYQSSKAYFKASLLRGENESPVFQGQGGRWVQVAHGFEAWLVKRCKDARRKYNKREWTEVVAGPPPFTSKEQRIVEARRRFACQLVGVTPEGKLLLEVHNDSGMTLPFLSIGIKWENSNLQGGIWLPTAHVRPGQRAIIEHSVYNPPIKPQGVAVVLLPEPEDRERYWEFHTMSS